MPTLPDRSVRAMLDDNSSSRSAAAADFPAKPAQASARREIWIRLLLYPGHTLPTAAAPILVAVGLAIRDDSFAFWPVALVFLGSWLIHVAGVFLDNHELLRLHADVPEHPELLRALHTGTLSLRGLRLAILVCLAGAAAAGTQILQLGGSLAWVIGLAGVLASLAYAGGPFSYARTGLAEPIFFLMFGVVAVIGTYYIQFVAIHGAVPGLLDSVRLLPADVYFVGWPVGALVTNVLIIDDIRDVAFDATKGWRTGAVRFGIRFSRIRFVALYVLAYAAPIVFCFWPGYGASILLPLLTVPAAWLIASAVWTHPPLALLPMTPRASLLALAYATLMAIGLGLSAH
jgi:1,4-dihydroxy-2-naphthoate polyprenyltransferase